MGTRADFYVGRGEQAEWLGSIAWDGYPDGVDKVVLRAKSEPAYRRALSRFFEDRTDVTLPEQGWPWPWDNSQTTDYAYAFDGGKVYGSCFGHKWFNAMKPEREDHGDDKPTVFPDMTSRQKVTMGKRSGVIVIGANGPIVAD